METIALDHSPAQQPVFSGKVHYSPRYKYFLYDPQTHKIYGAKGYTIFQMDPDTHRKEKIIQLENKFGIVYKPAERLLRRGVANILKVGEGLLAIVVNRQIKILDLESRKIVNQVDILRGSKPLLQGILPYEGDLIFGDYWVNKDRVPARVYRWNIQKPEFEVIHEVAGTRHFHLVTPYRYEANKLLLTTGDYDPESRIFTLDLQTGKEDVIGEGSQEWRTVSVLQLEDSMVWGMDCPYLHRDILRYPLATKKLEYIRKIPGSGFYTTTNKSGLMFMGTTVENRYQHVPAIYVTRDCLSWEQVIAFKKDLWNTVYFGFGIIEFIHGQEHLEDLYINLLAIK